MARIIGRNKEIKELHTLYKSNQAHLVAIYGRRRVGKTFLVDQALNGKITFRHAGLSPVDEDVKRITCPNNSSISIIHCFCKVCPRATYPLHGLRHSLCWVCTFRTTTQAKGRLSFLTNCHGWTRHVRDFSPHSKDSGTYSPKSGNTQHTNHYIRADSQWIQQWFHKCSDLGGLVRGINNFHLTCHQES